MQNLAKVGSKRSFWVTRQLLAFGANLRPAKFLLPPISTGNM